MTATRTGGRWRPWLGRARAAGALTPPRCSWNEGHAGLLGTVVMGAWNPWMLLLPQLQRFYVSFQSLGRVRLCMNFQSRGMHLLSGLAAAHEKPVQHVENHFLESASLFSKSPCIFVCKKFDWYPTVIVVDTKNAKQSCSEMYSIKSQAHRRMASDMDQHYGNI